MFHPPGYFFYCPMFLIVFNRCVIGSAPSYLVVQRCYFSPLMQTVERQ
jgi:hypothetical protein